MHDILISKDAKGKVRIVDISCEWSDAVHGFLIIRKTSQYMGKVTDQPVIEILRGKAGRTISEQSKLEYASHVKKYCDKGYKNIKDFGLETLEGVNPEEFLGDIASDANGAPKPMLAKSYDGIRAEVFEKQHLGSNKLDGVRCLLHWKNNEVITASRGGGNYDVAANYIRKDPLVEKYLSEHPDIWLDGELYIHGRPLSYISGLCRLQTLDPRHEELKYYVYDIAIDGVPFKDRLKIIEDLATHVKDTDKIVIVEHIPISGWDNMVKLHDKFVSEGYEGLVIRDPDKNYLFGSRNNSMIKLKFFHDSEHKILGLVDGLRDEDMCFLMETPEGYQFKAKPIGDRALKQWYRDNIDSLIGQYGTIKHFGMTTTDTPVPNLPVFKSLRDVRDM